MSQMPARPNKEAAAIKEIVSVIAKRPIVEFGNFIQFPANYSQMNDATKAAIRMLREGITSARVTYASRKEARSIAHTLHAYRRRNNLPIKISQLGNQITMWPTKKKEV